MKNAIIMILLIVAVTTSISAGKNYARVYHLKYKVDKLQGEVMMQNESHELEIDELKQQYRKTLRGYIERSRNLKRQGCLYESISKF